MLTRLTAAIAAVTIATGTIAFAASAAHKAADLARADNAMLAPTSRNAIASSDALTKLAAAGERLWKVADVT